MFDDILIKDKEDIGLYPLNKVQYVMQDKKTPKKIKIDTFFSVSGFFWDKISLCPGTHSIEKASSFELTETCLPLSPECWD